MELLLELARAESLSAEEACGRCVKELPLLMLLCLMEIPALVSNTCSGGGGGGADTAAAFLSAAIEAFTSRCKAATSYDAIDQIKQQI